MDILIADDHPLTLMGTKAFVESLGHTVSSICSNGINAYNLILAKEYKIAILDINMPGMDGLEVLEKIYQNKLKTKVILLTMHRETSIYRRANELGVYGYLLKNHSEEELGICLKEVEKNRQFISSLITNELFVDMEDEKNIGLEKLTFAEKKVLDLVAKQLTSKKIAEMLFITEKTVEGHRSKIIEKLGLPKEKNVLLQWAAKQKDL